MDKERGAENNTWWKISKFAKRQKPIDSRNPVNPSKKTLKKIHTQTDHSQTSEHKLLKAKYLKAAREKQHIIYWGMIIQMTVDFIPKTMASTVAQHF